MPLAQLTALDISRGKDAGLLTITQARELFVLQERDPDKAAERAQELGVFGPKSPRPGTPSSPPSPVPTPTPTPTPAFVPKEREELRPTPSAAPTPVVQQIPVPVPTAVPTPEPTQVPLVAPETLPKPVAAPTPVPTPAPSIAKEPRRVVAPQVTPTPEPGGILAPIPVPISVLAPSRVLVPKPSRAPVPIPVATPEAIILPEPQESVPDLVEPTPTPTPVSTLREAVVSEPEPEPVPVPESLAATPVPTPYPEPWPGPIPLPVALARFAEGSNLSLEDIKLIWDTPHESLPPDLQELKASMGVNPWKGAYLSGSFQQSHSIVADIGIGMIPIFGTIRDIGRLSDVWGDLSAWDKISNMGLVGLSVLGDVTIVVGGVGLVLKGLKGAAVTGKVITSSVDDLVRVSARKVTTEVVADDAPKYLEAIARIPSSIKEVDIIVSPTGLGVRSALQVDNVLNIRGIQTRVVLEIESPLTATQVDDIVRTAREGGIRFFNIQIAGRAIDPKEADEAGRAIAAAYAKYGVKLIPEDVTAKLSASLKGGSPADLDASVDQLQTALRGRGIESTIHKEIIQPIKGDPASLKISSVRLEPEAPMTIGGGGGISVTMGPRRDPVMGFGGLGGSGSLVAPRTLVQTIERPPVASFVLQPSSKAPTALSLGRPAALASVPMIAASPGVPLVGVPSSVGLETEDVGIEVVSPAIEIVPSEVQEVVPATTPEIATQVVPEIEPAVVSPRVADRIFPEDIAEPEPETSISPAVRMDPEPEVSVMTSEQLRVEPEPVTETESTTEAPIASRVKTLRERLSAIRARLPSLPEKRKKTVSGIQTRAAGLAWKQGRLWVAIFPPFTEDDISYSMTSRPPGTRKVRSPKQAWDQLHNEGYEVDVNAYDEWASWFTPDSVVSRIEEEAIPLSQAAVKAVEVARPVAGSIGRAAAKAIGTTIVSGGPYVETAVKAVARRVQRLTEEPERARPPTTGYVPPPPPGAEPPPKREPPLSKEDIDKFWLGEK